MLIVSLSLSDDSSATSEGSNNTGTGPRVVVDTGPLVDSVSRCLDALHAVWTAGEASDMTYPQKRCDTHTHS